MNKLDVLKSLVSQRLLAAVEEVFSLIEGTINDVEAEKQRHLSENLANHPDVQLHSVPEEHSGLDPQPHFKEELSELFISPVRVKGEEGGCPPELHLVGSEPTPELDLPAEADSSTDEEDSDSDDSLEEEAANHQAAHKLLGCSRCNKKFTHSRDLKTHMASHTRKMTFRCSLCGKRYMKKAYLIQHMAAHKSCEVCQGRHGVECHRCRGGAAAAAKSYSCSVCGRVFLQKGYLIKHMERLQFHCLVCKKNFCYHNMLKNHSCPGGQAPGHSETFPSSPHMRSDDELSDDSDSSSSSSESQDCSPQKLSCSLCHKTFSSSANLRRHARVHTLG
ncbi:uncharacterized protein ACB058_014206 [Synchiropus picturatus]